MVNRRSGIIIAVAGYLLGLSIEGPKLFKVREAFLPTETSRDILDTSRHTPHIRWGRTHKSPALPLKGVNGNDSRRQLCNRSVTRNQLFGSHTDLLGERADSRDGSRRALCCT